MRRSRAVPALVLLTVCAACAVVGHLPGRDAPRGVDLNCASTTDLASLPGVDADVAERIVAARPFATKDEVVRRGVVSESVFARFRDRVYLGRAAPQDAADARSVPEVPE